MIRPSGVIVFLQRVKILVELLWLVQSFARILIPSRTPDFWVDKDRASFYKQFVQCTLYLAGFWVDALGCVAYRQNIEKGCTPISGVICSHSFRENCVDDQSGHSRRSSNALSLPHLLYEWLTRSSQPRLFPSKSWVVDP